MRSRVAPALWWKNAPSSECKKSQAQLRRVGEDTVSTAMGFSCFATELISMHHAAWFGVWGCVILDAMCVFRYIHQSNKCASTPLWILSSDQTELDSKPPIQKKTLKTTVGKRVLSQKITTSTEAVQRRRIHQRIHRAGRGFTASCVAAISSRGRFSGLSWKRESGTHRSFEGREHGGAGRSWSLMNDVFLRIHSSLIKNKYVCLFLIKDMMNDHKLSQMTPK